MGFHVSCDGIQLLREISASPNEFLEEPYSLYIIALATSIDDDVLEWLIENEISFDSLMGPLGAFFLFYNDARFKTRFFPKKLEEKSRSSNDSVNFALESNVIRNKNTNVDALLRFNPEFHVNKKVFIESMTYESDTIARELKILDKLPCLLIFDDPSEINFFYFPLNDLTEDTIKDFRKLIGGFFSESKYQNYFRLLKDWHSHNSMREQIEFKIASLKRYHKNHFKNESHIKTKFKKLISLLDDGMVKEFRRELNLFESSYHLGYTSRLPWQEIRVISNEIHSSNSHLMKIKKISKMENIDEYNRNSEHIMRNSERLLKKEFPVKELSTFEFELKKFKKNQLKKIKTIIIESLGIQFVEKKGAYAWKKNEDRLKVLERKIDTTVEELKHISRPKIKNHIQKYNKKRKNKIRLATIQHIGFKALEETPRIIDILSKSISITGD